jgi:hypothetical protein
MEHYQLHDSTKKRSGSFIAASIYSIHSRWSTVSIDKFDVDMSNSCRLCPALGVSVHTAYPVYTFGSWNLYSAYVSCIMSDHIFVQSNGKVLDSNVSIKSKAFHAASNPRQILYGCCDEKIIGLCGKIAGVRGGQCLCSNLKCKGRSVIWYS